MRFRFVVEVDVERTEGKFASREELAQQIQDAIEAADPNNLEGDNGGQYDVTDWQVYEEEWKKEKKSANMEARVQQLIRRAFDDCFDGGLDGGSLSREELLNRLRAENWMLFVCETDKEAYKVWNKMSEPVQDAVLKNVFRADFYRR